MSAPISSPHPAIPILTGPTGIGKTAYSLEIAERLNAEIISADSRQIYRELNIGTAKPDADALSRIPHHFVSELSLGASYSAGQFARQAYVRIRGILDRQRLPLVVGGSTLYLHALQRGLSAVPEADLDVRSDLEAQLARDGTGALFEELCQVDPDAAAHLDPTKTSRVVRALEVFRSTGTPLSHYHAIPSRTLFTFTVVVLDMDRTALYERINRRVDCMVSQGLVDEVRTLLEAGHDPAVQALQTIGYREAIGFLQAKYDRPEMIRLIKRNTRRYAKRQLTWFRRYPKYNRVQLTAQTAAARSQAIAEIQSAYGLAPGPLPPDQHS